jgi:hypothetical protein
MAEPKKEKKSYLKEVMHFYFAPKLRSVGTIFYLVIYGFFTIYYIDNFLLAVKFVLYILYGHTALESIAYLFTGTAFVISLIIPFSVSFYSLFVIFEIWKHEQWSRYAKSMIATIVVIGGIIIMILSNEAAHLAARQPVMQSFVEDMNLTGRI